MPGSVPLRGSAFVILAVLVSLFASACTAPPKPTPTAAYIYRDNCQVCHGPGGRGGVWDPVRHRAIPALKSSLWSHPGGGRILTSFITEGSLVASVPATGAVNMPGWSEVLSPKQLSELATYLQVSPTPAAAITNPADGKQVYRTSGCQTCHGPLGSSSGGVAPAIPVGQPPSFYLGPLRQGVVPVDTDHPLGRIGGPIMPAIGRLLPSESFWSLLSYLQNGRPTPLCRQRVE